jgi:hypothetical protein
MITMPVSVSQTIAARPMVIMITTPFPKYWNPVVILSGNRQSPKAIKIATITTGSRLPMTTSAPPASHKPSGNTTDRDGDEASQHTKRQILAVFDLNQSERNRDRENDRRSHHCAQNNTGIKTCLRDRSQVAWRAGSHPYRLPKGLWQTWLGRHRGIGKPVPQQGVGYEARTGAREITPTIARPNGPIALKPFSNSFPNPNRFPRIRSMAPRTIKTIMIQMMITLISTVFLLFVFVDINRFKQPILRRNPLQFGR